MNAAAWAAITTEHRPTVHQRRGTLSARGREHFSTPIRMLDVPCANPVVMDGLTIPQVDDLRVFGFITNDR